MDNEDKSFLAGLIIGAVASFIICFLVWDARWKTEIVKHHAAHWAVDDAGNSTFVWNQPEDKP